ncbi:MAG: heme ABC exporter ATP-binding protein CcmA [Pseudomonadota bacterium]
MLRTTAPLTIRRSGKTVLSDVSFDIPGGITVLRGPNGSGKTTLLRCLAGLITPSAGAFETGGEDPVFCGHLDAVKSAISVSETLSFWSAIYGASVPDTVESLGLAPLMETPVALLSAGQKRRLGLARAVIAPTPIKLFDEPTTALDAAHRQSFFDLVERTTADGATIVMSSHDDLLPQNAAMLELSAFQAKPDTHDDPFLDEAFL